jgi:flavin-dependent dehydrogenase
MLEVDVLVVGAGPAGATAALNLAPMRRTALMDASAAPHERIGESLAPAARRLLTDMRLFDEFLREGHALCYGNRAVWGSAQPVETSFLSDPDGHGWHLDRARFETWLRAVAVRRGATLLIPSRLESVQRESGRWKVTVSTAGVPSEVSARFLIDAGGRAAPAARRLGSSRRDEDRLVCIWAYGCGSVIGRGAGFTFVEAVEDGWWYTAPLPGGRRVLAFHTDADLPAARAVRDVAALLGRASETTELRTTLADCGFRASGGLGVCAAYGSMLDPCAGEAWLAAGDAAICFDPLSAQGLLNALFTGLAAAEAADRYLSGVFGVAAGYMETVCQIHRAYRDRLEFCYRGETRWMSAPFWQRRA